MKQINKLLFVAIIYMSQACANDGPQIQLVGDFSNREISIIQKSADEWCNVGMDCISFTRESRSDTIEIVSNIQEICEDQRGGASGCDKSRRDITNNDIDEHSEVYIKNNRANDNWNIYLQHVALHELGHYLVFNSVPHIVTTKQDVVMREMCARLPITLSNEDVKWAHRAFTRTDDNISF